MIFHFFFFLHGFFGLLAQVIILRELMVAFYGNELFSGIFLAIWLLGTGTGSLLALRLRKFKNLRTLFLLQILLFFTIFLEIFLIRLFVGKAVLIGEIPSLFLSLFFVFLILFPFCFFLDSLFAWATNFWARKTQEKTAFLVSRAYLFETLGLVLAGLVFSFFLITTTFPLPSGLNHKTLRFRFPNLVETVNSRYGNIAVTRTGEQYNFYESGSLLGTTQEKESSEYLAHLILTQHKQPQKILLIGGGLNGLIFEILKYPSIKKIDYVELDPKLVEVQKKYLPEYLIETSEDPRVKINLVDGRKFLKETKEGYDLVIFNLPNPSTALINRFYTQECFNQVKQILDKDGIFATSLFAPVDYLSQEAQDLVILTNQTLKNVFSDILILPEETEILFLASADKVLVRNPAIIKERFEKNKFDVSFASGNYLEYRLTSPQIKRIEKILQRQNIEKINLDFHPLAYFFESAFWQTMFSFKTAKIFRSLALLDFKVILAISLIIYFLFFNCIKTRKQISFLLTFLGGFTLMSFEMLIIFIFQSTLGLIFSKIALIFTLILSGLALGNLWATKKKLAIKKIFLAVIVYGLFFLLLIQRISSEILFYTLAGIIGFLEGAVFPLANKILFARKKEVSQQTGFLYAADLFGAFCGALLPSLFLIPLFGVKQTVWLLMLFNSFPLLKKLERYR